MTEPVCRGWTDATDDAVDASARSYALGRLRLDSAGRRGAAAGVPAEPTAAAATSRASRFKRVVSAARFESYSPSCRVNRHSSPRLVHLVHHIFIYARASRVRASIALSSSTQRAAASPGRRRVLGAECKAPPTRTRREHSRDYRETLGEDDRRPGEGRQTPTGRRAANRLVAADFSLARFIPATGQP